TQTESTARCRQRLSVTIDEQRSVVRARATPQESGDNVCCFRPERRDPLFSPFSQETNMAGRLQTNVLRAEIKRLLDARSGVVEQRKQRVIALSFGGSSVGLSKNHRYFLRLQITHGFSRRPLQRHAH